MGNEYKIDQYKVLDDIQKKYPDIKIRSLLKVTDNSFLPYVEILADGRSLIKSPCEVVADLTTLNGDLANTIIRKYILSQIDLELELLKEK